MKGQTSPDRQKIEVVLTNHERTKHHLHRYARSLGYLDWATQPDPFRTYEGAPKIPLSRNLRGWGKPYDALHLPWGEGEPLSLETLGVFFRLALGLSAWKAFGEHRWALRCNPSSGNLHPTEGYALLPTIPGIEGGVYHYVSRDHLLEARCTIPPERRDRWNDLFTPGGFGVGLSSIHWREAWKYGERAYRYCQLDVGHAIGSIGYAAAVLGWRIHLLDTPGDDDIEALLGLEREEDFRRCGEVEREAPDLLLLVTTGRERSPFEARLDEAIDIVRHGRWQGAANALSPDHFFWEQIEVVAQAARKPRTPSLPPPVGEKLPPPQGTSRCNAVELILQRRSAVAMDGRRTIPRERFHAILDRLLPRPRIFPWAALPWQPRIHPVFFVHRVEGLPAGLYLLERDPSVGVPLRRAIRGSVRWERPPGTPRHLPFHLLREGDFRQIAAMVSCHQEIAAEGAFSLGMLADFRGSLAQGAWWYRRLFWEAGWIGQILYLEAEAAGLRGTGIGCYFDDAFHDLLELADDRFQSLYHFTVGGPVDDPRLTTLPPYSELGEKEGIR